MWESKYTRNAFVDESSYLSHHGILGQKWGVRRFQNEDGSLTPAGEKRYGSGDSDSKPMSKREKRKAEKVEENKRYREARATVTNAQKGKALIKSALTSSLKSAPLAMVGSVVTSNGYEKVGIALTGMANVQAFILWSKDYRKQVKKYSARNKAGVA